MIISDYHPQSIMTRIFVQASKDPMHINLIVVLLRIWIMIRSL